MERFFEKMQSIYGLIVTFMFKNLVTGHYTFKNPITQVTCNYNVAQTNITNFFHYDMELDLDLKSWDEPCFFF